MKRLGSHPGSTVWGWLPSDRAPALRVASGEVVAIDTLSHQGLLQAASPVDFFAQFGIPASEVLADAVAVHAAGREDVDAGAHVVTGPVHVAGATPGDALEVRFLEAVPRVPYGVNAGRPGAGVLPDLLDEPSLLCLGLGPDERTFRLGDHLTLPLRPFPGLVATAPPSRDGAERVSTKPPGAWGGNLDLKELTPGSSVWLPVFQPGGQFYIGDPHGTQGDGEVNGTALEQSMSFVVEFVLHPGVTLAMPRAETPEAHLVLGIDEDLDTALAIAVGEAVTRLRELTDGALSTAEAYAACSLAVDFGISEAVNITKTVRGTIPKALFA